MSTISSMLSSLLQDYKTSTGSVDSTSTSTETTTPTASETGTYGDAYVLDLSQAAQDILNSKGSTSTISLTEAQKEKLKTILDKYKDAPANNDTLSALYADLKKAGLAPDELAAIQQAKDFNPTLVLLKILSGLSDNDDSSSTESTLSGLSSTASGTPIGDLLEKYKAANPSSGTGTLTDALNNSSSNSIA